TSFEMDGSAAAGCNDDRHGHESVTIRAGLDFVLTGGKAPLDPAFDDLTRVIVDGFQQFGIEGIDFVVRMNAAIRVSGGKIRMWIESGIDHKCSFVLRRRFLRGSRSDRT